MRARKAGQIVATPRPTFEERFLAKILKTDGCWVWTSDLDKHTYGRFRVGKRHVGAHRVAYELFVGPIPEGLELDHACHTADLSCPGGDSCLHRRCVNPAHLEPVTHVENTMRGRSFGVRQLTITHCPQGHAYDTANTYVRPGDTSRQCRRCHADEVARARARKRSQATPL